MISLPIPNADTINRQGESPFPAWLLSGALLAKSIGGSKPLPSNLGSGGSYKTSVAMALEKPSRATCLTFGAAHLLGGYITYDGDITNGAGFSFAWSTLYVLVNGRSSLKSVFRGHFSPLALAVLATGNAGIYGRKFFWP
ncbi:hypothetical protein PGUG_01975 [Meyerozyma guilliermondii ATCC 6260]|uniref:Altered inheritance of mitochondria protein 19 n=1 Tax=Meyerozyma guilliermondii (strain ATCC 6260 / CBS 566 / DSM 6381 / JCM 1539 / NBRC 10279 / NRRL Y-324) TaxID=294746 RepID=A5DFC4_PICGU|nr:uncharacterized protein PGUG_01975 [Meyerozyma guilliermondii ATCC 6260]EDK37877.2 hypothetical protein PGUG_01975 [Meyerozyma guilliermondii ATCC 6260]